MKTVATAVQIDPHSANIDAAPPPPVDSKLASLKHAVCEATTRHCQEEFGACLRSVVLTGSLARDEATCVEEGEYCRVLGDAEFLLVFDKAGSLPSTLHVELTRRQIENSLRSCAVLCHVGLSAVALSYFEALRPAIFAYELVACGQVVWGDPDVLSLVPRFSAKDIPLEDAWRLLCNRMIELLEVASSLPSALMPLPYSAVKLYLDMATSFLVFEGAYEPTYREREAKLRSLAENAPEEDGHAFFPLRRFSERVTACTEFKLGAHLTPGQQSPSTLSWIELCGCTQALWRWELTRLVQTEFQSCSGRKAEGKSELSCRELARKWRRLQPLDQKLRGWAYVARRRGWLRSWFQWPRWLILSFQGSPRYLIYEAASEIFFQLGALLPPDGKPNNANLDFRKLRACLPVAGGSSACQGRGRREGSELVDRRYTWQRLACEIAWNYHEFLEGTRA